MKKFSRILIGFTIFMFCFFSAFNSTESFVDADNLGEATAPPPMPSCSIEPFKPYLKSFEEVKAFYARRGFQKAWLNTDGRVIRRLYDFAVHMPEEGLASAGYHVDVLGQWLGVKDNEQSIMPYSYEALEYLLTDTYITMSKHLHNGQYDDHLMQNGWGVDNDFSCSINFILEEALQRNRILESLEAINSDNQRYIDLKRALHRYDKLANAGGWDSLDIDLPLKLGDSTAAVNKVRQRLLAEGFFDRECSTTDTVYDDEIMHAIARFQISHGLEPDGNIGKRTLGMLNVPVDQKVRIIKVNMERMRWLNGHFDQKHVMINVPTYTLTTSSGEKDGLEMPIVVGKPSRETPLFSSEIKYVTLNPYWSVPPTILSQDVLPKIKNDPSYLAKHNMSIINGSNDNISADSVDWQGRFRYTLRQMPGPSNPLGRLKFYLDNDQAIYLHDTPSRTKFKQANRALSSGCIRLSEPVKLAANLLSDKGWTEEQVQQKIDRGIPSSVLLSEPVEVHIVYFTVWPDDEGNILFAQDIYGLDKEMLELF
ncbi:MAG: L,D-transpeptidase family protein [Bacteroidota bacterium]